jgi:hypothetical protein
MVDFMYDLKNFKWVKEANSYYANMEDLYPLDRKYHFPFPNGKRSFLIKNFKTSKIIKLYFVREEGDVDNPIWLYRSGNVDVRIKIKIYKL